MMATHRKFSRETGWDDLEIGARYRIELAFDVDGAPLVRAGRFLQYDAQRGRPLVLVFQLTGGREQRFGVNGIRELTELERRREE